MLWYCFGGGPGKRVDSSNQQCTSAAASKVASDPSVKPFCDPTNSLSTPDNIEQLKASEAPTSLERAVSACLEIQAASKPQVPRANAPDASWDKSLLDAIPFSVAVVSSDTSEVLHCRFGSEPGACQLLSQTLQQSSLSSTPFLTALLGPKLEAAALRTVKGGRMWKGSMPVQFVQGGPTSGLAAASNTDEPSPAPVTPFLEVFPHSTIAAAGVGSQQRKFPDSTEAAAEVATSAHLGPAEAEGAHVGLAAAAAAAAESRLESAAAAKPCREQPGEREVSVGAGLQHSFVASPFVVESHNSAQALWQPTAEPIDIPNTAAGVEESGKSVQWKRQQGQARQHEQPTNFRSSSTLNCSPFFLANERTSCGKVPDRAALSANGMKGELDGAVPHADLGPRSSSAQLPDAKIELLRSTSAHLLEAKSRPNPKKTKSFSASSRSPRGSRRSSIVMSEKAMEWFILSEGGASESGSPGNRRTVSFLRSLSKQEGLNREDREDSVENQGAGLSSSIPSTEGTTPPPRQSSFQGSNQYKHQRRVFGSRTVQSDGQVDTLARNSQEASFSGDLNSTQMPYSSGLTQFPIDEAEENEGEPTSHGSQLPLQQPETFSFDIVVTQLRPQEGPRSPLLAVMANSTEHLQVRATLSALAESQLELISSIIPQHAVQFLALESTAAVPKHVGQLARAHKGITLMFMDICGFTQMSKEVEPGHVLVFLNTLFSLFDQLTDIYGVHKVETAGDCYIVSGGIMSPKHAAKGFGLVVEEEQVDPAESAKRVMNFSKALLGVAEQVRMPNNQQPVRVRVGLHTGDVVSGLIGSKLPKFSIFGDTMNTASRMESTGVPGRIHVSEATHKLLMEDEKWEPTGGVEVKGKGMMQTYLWVPDPTPGHTEKEVLTGPLSPVTSELLPCMLIKTTQALLQQLSTSLPLVGRPGPPPEQWLSHQHTEDSFLVPVCDRE